MEGQALFFDRLSKLDFYALMQIYEEGNRVNGMTLYPDLSADRQLFLAQEDFRDYLQEVFFRQKGAHYAVWTVDQHYVSALRLEPYEDGWLLSALETAPAYRRKGYASALIHAVIQTGGYGKLYSHIHKKNTNSIRVHLGCGFYRKSDSATYLDGTVTTHSATFIHESK